jgi:hypothetical protein
MFGKSNKDVNPIENRKRAVLERVQPSFAFGPIIL